MNKPLGWGGVALVALLAACGSVIPPQNFTNPIGVTGRAVQVQIGASAVTAASAGLGIIKSSFPDIDTSAVPVSLNASQSLFKVGFTSNAHLDTSGTPPCSIILTQLNINVTISDSLKTYVLPNFALNKEVRLEQDSQDPTSYKIVTNDVYVGNVLQQQDAKKLQDIITSGGLNQVDVHVSLQATSVPELPPGSILTFTFDTSDVTLKF